MLYASKQTTSIQTEHYICCHALMLRYEISGPRTSGQLPTHENTKLILCQEFRMAHGQLIRFPTLAEKCFYDTPLAIIRDDMMYNVLTKLTE